MEARTNHADAAFAWAEFASDLRFKDIPEAVSTVARRDILDLIGCIVAGGRSAPARSVASLMKAFGGKEESTVFGQDCRLPAPNAAMANGALAHALDFDDVYDGPAVHCGLAVVPAALAAAERVGNVSGEELLTAVTLGLEMVTRMADAALGGARGNWTSQTWGYMGAALAAGRILGLNKDGLVNALGLALGQASGTRQFIIDRGSHRAVYAGFAAQGGVMAALLAENGLTGARDSLEGQYGFYSVYQNKHYDSKILTRALGQEYVTSKLGFKYYPSCRNAHSYVDAVLKIMGEHNVSPRDIRGVRAHVGRFTADLCEPRDVRVNPLSPNQAQYSIPYVVALAIVRGRCSLRDFLTDEFRSPDVLGMAQLVAHIEDPTLSAQGVEPAIVEIETSAGRYVERVDHPKGSPGEFDDRRRV